MIELFNVFGIVNRWCDSPSGMPWGLRWYFVRSGRYCSYNSIVRSSLSGEWELVHVFAHVITEWRLRIRAKHPNPRVSFFNLWEAFEELDGEPQSAE